MKKEEVLKTALELNQKQLLGFTIEDFIKLDAETLTDEEYRARAGDAEIFYKNHFEKVIDLLILTQLKYLGETAENDSMLLIGRGSINGLYNIKRWFQNQVAVSKSRFQSEEGE